MLSLAMLAGCATQQVRFTSDPSGAVVVAGRKQGVTPCTLTVSDSLTHATFRLPSGEELVMPMSGLDSELEEASEVTGQIMGGTLMFSGYVVGGAGVAVFLLVAGSMASDADEGDHADSETYAIMGASLLTAFAGLGMVGLGKWIYPDNAVPVLHAGFFSPAAGSTNAPGGEAQYEDVGYGARRLRKAVQ